MSQNIPRKSMGSAADWCKAVVEEVAPQITTIPPPPLPPILKLTSKTTTTNTATSPTPSLSGAVSAATMAQFERYNAQSQSSSTGLVSMNS